MSDDGSSIPAYAGVGGLVACCLVLELLGGVAVLGSIAAVGLSTELTYVAVVGLVSVLIALVTLGYRQYGQTNHI